MARKVYGGWSAFGSPKFDDSSVSGGRPIATHGNDREANRDQTKINEILNCRKCKKLPEGAFCGKHAKDGASLF